MDLLGMNIIIEICSILNFDDSNNFDIGKNCIPNKNLMNNKNLVWNKIWQWFEGDDDNMES